MKQRQEEEKKHLVALRDQLRPVVHTEQVSGPETPADRSFQQVLSVGVAPLQDTLPKQVYSMHQLTGDRQYGTERAGFLYKKSDG